MLNYKSFTGPKIATPSSFNAFDVAGCHRSRSPRSAGMASRRFLSQHLMLRRPDTPIFACSIGLAASMPFLPLRRVPRRLLFTELPKATNCIAFRHSRPKLFGRFCCVCLLGGQPQLVASVHAPPICINLRPTQRTAWPNGHETHTLRPLTLLHYSKATVERSHVRSSSTEFFSVIYMVEVTGIAIWGLLGLSPTSASVILREVFLLYFLFYFVSLIFMYKFELYKTIFISI